MTSKDNSILPYSFFPEENLAVFNIQSHEPLLTDSGWTTVNELETFIELLEESTNKRSIYKVLIIQDGPYADSSADFISDLNSKKLVIDTFSKLAHLRHLFQKINQSSLLWVYACNQQCTGILFELALSCHRRIAFSTELQVGFPWIKANLFPCLFGLEASMKEHHRTLSQWITNPVLSIKEANRIGIFDFAVDSNDWKNSARKWVSDKALVSKNSPKENTNSGFLRRTSNLSINAEMESECAKLFERCENSGQSSLDYGSQAIAALSDNKTSSENIDFLLPYFYARILHSQNFKSWISRRLHQQSFLSFRNRNPSEVCIYIDLNFLIPSTTQIVAIITSQFNVIFFANSARLLSEGLNLIFSRCLRLFKDTNQMRQFWSQQVGWFVGQASLTSENVILRWTINDEIHLQTSKHDFVLYRLNSNRLDLPSGWAEIRATETQFLNTDPEIANVLSCLFDGIIATQQSNEVSFPLNSIVRYLFFNELVSYAIEHDISPIKIIGFLKQTGWGVVADEFFWESFIRYRKLQDNLDIEAIRKLGFLLSDKIWELNIWKDVINLRIRKTKKANPIHTSTNPAIISLHFGFFGYYMFEHLLQIKILNSRNEASILLTESLGFPDAYGHFDFFIQEYGFARYKSHKLKNFNFEN